MPTSGENSQSNTLHAELFGHLRVSGAGGNLALPASKKTRGLLGYLLASNRPRSRSELCDLLWEDAEDPRAALRWSLSKLRTALGPNCLVADRNTVEVSREVLETDLWQVHAISKTLEDAATKELVRAQSLFRGEFLNGLDLSECYSFYEWCQAERSRLGQLNEKLLLMLLSRTEGDPKTALEFAHKLAGLNPFEETAHIRVIEIQMALGRIDLASEQATQCRNVFQTELGIEPSPALEKACRPLASATRTAPAAVSNVTRVDPMTTAIFVGRSEELSMIHTALDQPISEIVLMIGEPGIGKSALLSEVQQQIDALHLSARAVEAERLRPLGVWHDALRSLDEDDLPSELRRDLQRLLADRPENTTNQSEQSFFDPYLAFFSDLARSRPVLILLDDLQWLEPSSCALLSYLFRNLADTQVKFCLAARVGEIDDNDAVQALLSGFGKRLRRLALTGLSEKEALTLTQILRPSEDVSQVVRKAQGNPLYLRELARQAGGTSHPTLNEALSNRINRLSQPAINFASWASVVGRRIPMEKVIEAAGESLSTALDLVDELERHEVTRPIDSGLSEFTHDLVRNAVYEQISNTRRNLMHARFADLFAKNMATYPDQAAQVLHHAGMSERNELAAHAAILAGDQALRSFANSEATEIAKKGLFHSEKIAPGPVKISLIIRNFRVRVHAGSGLSKKKFPKLIEELTAQAALANQRGMAPEVAEAEHLLSVLYQEVGDHEAASRATTRAATSASRMGARKKIRQLANSARCLLELGRDLPKAKELCENAYKSAEDEGISDIEIFWSQGLLAYWNGDLSDAADLLGQALSLARDSEDRWRECKCQAWTAMIALERDQPKLAVIHSENLRTLSFKIGEGGFGPLADAICAVADNNTENLNEALSALEQADDKSHLAYILNLAAERQIRSGSPQRAIELVRRAYFHASLVNNENEKALAQAQAYSLGEDLGDPAILKAWRSSSSQTIFSARVQRILGQAFHIDRPQTH